MEGRMLNDFERRERGQLQMTSLPEAIRLPIA
jgi:hypothetical protein